MPEFIRVTIGTSEENRFFIEALKIYINYFCLFQNSTTSLKDLS